MLVYRDGRRRVAGCELLSGLQAAVARLDLAPAPPDEAAILDALVRAGELECALGDAESRAALAIAQLTDSLADQLLDPRGLQFRNSAIRQFGNFPVPATLSVSAPEGFAYYALHPRHYAELAERALLAEAPVAVIGIRSIGTTLSAVVVAAARRRSLPAERITVRPAGHPFDRHTRFSEEQRTWIGTMVARRARFLVVDEGPGLSGSSFLSVAEALERDGVPARQITLLASHAARPEMMCAPQAAERWPRFQCLAVEGGPQVPAEAAVSLCGGQWRRHFGWEAARWPACWPAVERAKFLSRDGRMLFKFEGFGAYGSAPIARSAELARAGFGPRVADAGQGFAAYEILAGERLPAAPLSGPLLRELARYCAFRRETLATDRICDPAPLAELLQTNVREELAFEAGDRFDVHYEAAPAVITDGRMQPHEWLPLPDGRLQKFDAASHGDDHFYPGPTDIAWDLAGAIIEWAMDQRAAELFVNAYRNATADDPTRRLPFFLAAYAAFRVGWCRMAEGATGDPQEKQRLRRAGDGYRAVLERGVRALAPRDAARVA